MPDFDDASYAAITNLVRTHHVWMIFNADNVVPKANPAGDDKYVDTFSFRKNHRADSVLMLVKHTIDRGHLPDRWLFLHRAEPASPAYCVVSRGVTFGQHEDMPENASANAFGPPASGLPRCAASNADFRREII